MSTDKNNQLQASGPQLWQLEPRLMFDGAAVDTTVDALVDSGADLAVTEAADGLFALAVAHGQSQPAAEQAQQQIKDYLSEASAEQLFALFNGGKTDIDMAWLQAMEAERQAILSGQVQVTVELLDNAAMQGALGAFAAAGPDGTAVIYLNRDWIEAGADTAEVARVLAEEFGHSIDARVNDGADTAGDEGERFAAAVTGSAVTDTTSDGRGVLDIDGVSVEVEFATYSFVNAYEVNTATTPAGKESNTHDFIYKSGQVSVTIDDNNFDSRLFSGNDVSATAININGTDYYGWVSRPIKVQGEVKGFYFWTDADFTDLAKAQADGNRDNDRDVTDNRAFVLVVDQAYFNTLTSGASDGALINIGSSSDRVDSALNALVGSNSAPVAVVDSDTVTEGGSAITGNVLGNDIDTDSGDDITLVQVGTSAANQTVTSGTTSANGTSVLGQYGSLVIGADGSYSYTVGNSAEVQALGSGDSLTDTFIYTINDKEGLAATTTLTITINGANDAPVAADDYNSAKESLRTTNAYASDDPLGSKAIGNVLDNDTDANGDNLTIDAPAGNVVVGSVTDNVAASQLTFAGENGFNAVKSGHSLYLNVGGTYRALHAADGSLITVTENPSEDPSVSGTYYVSLSSTAAYYLSNPSDPNSKVSIDSLDAEMVGFASGNDEAISKVTGSMKTATVTSSQATGTSTVTPTITTGLVAAGMSVTGCGVPDGTTVSSVSYDNSGNITAIELSQVITGSNGDSLSFSAALGDTLTGQYGTLVLNADGSYVYTPFADNSALSEGQSATESFAYTARDAAGATSSATLNIIVYGSGSNDPNAVADIATATEAGGVANATDGINPTGNVLTDSVTGDTTPVGSNTVTFARSAGDAGETAVATDTVITGQYGTLTLSDDGSYSYVLNNSLAAVQALNSGDSLTETFIYTIANGSSPGTDSATLTITINGANDAPVANDDSATAIEAGGNNNTAPGYNPSGNVLANDTDVDDAAADLRVTAVRIGNTEGEGTAGSLGSALAGSYGSLTLNADGSWSYEVDQDNAAVNALAPGQTLTESFNFTVTDQAGAGLSDTAVLTITVQGARDVVAVSNVFVNEASPYAVFTVSGVEGVSVSLTLSDTTGLSAGDTKADLTGLSADIGSTLEYFDGSSWQPYGGAVTMSASGAFLVRVAVNQDAVHEGNESFTLVATTDGSVSTGIGTINDEGDGDVYLESNTTGTAKDPTDGDYPTLDDDRPTLSISSPTVTEGGYAEFTVSLNKASPSDISFTPTLNSGTATIGTGTDGDTAAASSLEISTDGGSSWSTVSGYVTIAAGETSVKLRVATTDDSDAEPAETFTLVTGTISGAIAGLGTVTNEAGVTGTATITDNDSVNSVPSSTNDSVTTVEDTTKVLGADDFGSFADVDGDSLAGVQITSLETAGSLEYFDGSDWVAVTLNQAISKADLDAGYLRFVPGENESGNDYSEIGFKVSDGTVYSDSSYTLTVNVDAANDAP
ncbi:beta strand repeat-containing protein, partial [Oceanisphaera psychrotolerans]|uniref:beta strand repeat-containing protein n=1 Tax=Oceanisphaera psychrotolerans TaxID=1414654 RepID=UPI000A682743